MTGYLMPIAFLAVVFVAFALINRNQYRSCGDCTGDCDKSQCEKRD